MTQAAAPASRPPIDDDRRSRSPGMVNNFSEQSRDDFRRPHGSIGATPIAALPVAPPSVPEANPNLAVMDTADTTTASGYGSAFYAGPPKAPESTGSNVDTFSGGESYLDAMGGGRQSTHSIQGPVPAPVAAAPWPTYRGGPPKSVAAVPAAAAPVAPAPG